MQSVLVAVGEDVQILFFHHRDRNTYSTNTDVCAQQYLFGVIRLTTALFHNTSYDNVLYRTHLVLLSTNVNLLIGLVVGYIAHEHSRVKL